MSESKNIQIIQASKKQIYQALNRKETWEFWLAPDAMRGKIHHFDFKTGGGYSMSLFYEDVDMQGKTSANEDRFQAKFVLLQPNEKIVQTINFISDSPQFKQEMIMEIRLEDAGRNATRVIILFRDIPPGINPRDNEAGTEQSLKKLAQYMEAGELGT